MLACVDEDKEATIYQRFFPEDTGQAAPLRMTSGRLLFTLTPSLSQRRAESMLPSTTLPEDTGLGRRANGRDTAG